MSNMCLIVTPSIKKVADQIKQEYPKACERNGFTDQMCAEWVGLYNNTNSQSPDNVPSMKSLVNFIEKLRNKEGRSFLRDLDEEFIQFSVEPVSDVTIEYNLPGQKAQTYTIRGRQIFNKKGEEVFKESDPNAKTHRNRIFANLAVRQGRAVVVEYKNNKYVVNNRGDIMSASGKKPGHLMQWEENNGDRKAILALAQPELEKKTATTKRFAVPNALTPQLIDHLKSMGINVFNRAQMEQYFKEHPNTLIQQATDNNGMFSTENDDIQMAIGKRRISINDSLSSDEKSNIRTLLKTINRTGTTLLDNGDGTMYLLDHTDKEGIENRNPKNQDGFNCRLKFSTDGYTDEELETIKNEIENGNIRDQKSFDKWAKSYITKQRSNKSNRIITEVRGTNGNNDNLYLRASEGESLRERSNTSSSEDFGTGFIRVYENDGTNGPRYIPIETNNTIQSYITPQGEVYGFADSAGNIYLDETMIDASHPIHEYTHLWDRALAKNNPELWQRGVKLMQEGVSALWDEIANSENYGKKWQSEGITGDRLTNLIASEVHSRLTGDNGAKLLDQIAKEQGNDSIIAKLKQWILDAWKELKATFGSWSQEEINKLTLKDFNHMTVRDFADGINPNTIQMQQPSQQQPSSVSSSSRAEEGESGNLGLPLTGSPVGSEKNLVVTEEQRIPKPLSPSYENALKTPTDEQKAFYNAFSPAQIVDRAKMIAHRFSDIIDDIIYDRRDYFREIINDSNATAEEKAMAKESLKVYEDPILAREAASDYRSYSVIMNEIKEDLRTWAEYATDDTVKTKLENTVTYFNFLANEAAKWIEQEEGIRQGKENSSNEENQEDEDLGDNDSGESSNGNEGFVTKERFVNPFSTLSKMVKRVCGGIETGREDDLGNARTYTQEYIYSALISYLSKTIESPDDFIQVTPKEELSTEMREEYPWGYPTFPALEQMQDKYPWAKQIIARLTNDYRKRDEADSTQLQYPSTFGSLASQFYVNFRKAFIPYGKIQVGVDKNGKPYFGVTPLNYDMEEKSQLDALISVYNNGIVLSDDSVYNGDKTINQGNAKKMCNSIRDIVKDRNKIEGLFYAYNDYTKEGYPIEDKHKALAKEILNIIRAFGIDMTEDNLSYLITAEDRGRTLKNMLSDLWELGNKIATADPNTIVNKNYLEEYKDFWKNFFVGRGFVTETNMMQSFYDPASQKTRYSYSGDNYLQKTFRHLFSQKFTLEERRAYINEHFGKYEWFRDQTAPEGTGWKLRWLESAYDDNNPAASLPYRNINCIDEVDKDGEHTVRDYRDWTTSDKYRVMLRSWDTNSDKYAYYLAPIFADSPVSMTVRGPKYSREQLKDGFIKLIDQELARIKYVKETRAQAIKDGEVLPINSFEKMGRKFCFIPELNEEVFGPDGNMSFLDYVTQLRDNYDNTDSKAAGSFDQALKDAEIEAVNRILDAKYNEFFNAMPDDVMEEMIKGKVTQESRENLKENLRLPYYNMVYADSQIVELTTVDLAFYKNLTEFQKRFKEVYASGGRVNTNSRYGKKTGRVLTISDEEITSPSYNNISIIVNKALKEGRITASERDYILSCYAFLGKGGVNVSDAQALRSLSSVRSILDMQGLWDDRLESTFQRITSGEWDMDDFNTVFQTIKPFVFSVIEKNSGVGDQKIPVPIQHKNSELALLAMWDMISGGLRNSEKLKGINRFMENVVDSEGNPIADMIQFESAGKAGNQGVVNINYSHSKVIDVVESKEIPLFDKGNRQVGTISLEAKFKPNTEENSADNFDAIKEELTRKLIDKKLAADDKDGKKSQKIFNQIMDYFQPTAEEVVDILTDYATVKDDGGNVMINPDRVEEVPFEDYMIAQPTPPHHLDATVPQGSQGRNIIIADLPEDYTLTLEGRGGESVTFGKEDAIDLFQSLIVENLLQDYAGLKEIFKNKEALSKKVIELASTSPVYGRDFAEAFKVENGDFKLSPNSPTIYRKVQQLVNSIIKKNIAVQKVDGAALIQASGIGLRDDLNLVYDENDKLVGAECYLPATSEKLFKPLMEKRRINGKDIMILDPEKLKKFGLDTAVGYRIPTENKSSMLPIIIKGFSPQQNGSAIFLPAEITTLSGSDFDVDKMFVVLSSFFVSEYRMADARRDFAKTNDMYKAILKGLAKAGNIEALEEDRIDGINEDAFTEWFAEHKEMYRREEPKVIKYKYDFSKSPKQNGRKARNTLLVQMMYKILTSQAGAENMFNPQNFEGVIGAAKMMKIMQDKNLLKKYMDKYSLNTANVGTHLLSASKEDLEQFVSDNDVVRSPIYPQTFDYFHHQNMVGDALLAMFALQVSAAAKFQRAQITIKAPQQFTVNGRHITSVDEIYNGLGEHRLKNVSQFVGACADNGKNPNVSDFGATRDNAKAIAYMLRAGLSIKEAALIINQPLMTDKKRRDELTDRGRNTDDIPVSSETLMTAILRPDDLSLSEEVAIAILCNKIINQSTSLAKLTNISRADSPNGGLPESFAKARIYKYKVDAFNAEQRTENFPFEPIEEAVSNNKIDLSESEDEIREKINSERMAMLTAFYSLGVQSFDYLMSPYFFMLDKKFDSLVTSRILENLPRNMSDAKKEEILESLYSSYITYALSDTNLFGNETDEATFRSKREYYLKQFPKDYIQILSENPGIREAIGKIIVNRNGRLVDDNKQRIKGQRDDIVRRITGLLYMDGPEAPEARKLAKDLFIYSYFDNGLQFTATSFSTLFSTQFVDSIEGYNEFLQNFGNDLNQASVDRFIEQFYNNNPQIAVDTKRKSEKPKVKDSDKPGKDFLIINRESNSSFENPASGNLIPYEFIKHGDVYYILESYDSMSIRYVPLTRFGDSKVLYNSSMTLDTMATYFPYKESRDEQGDDMVGDIAAFSASMNPDNNAPFGGELQMAIERETPATEEYTEQSSETSPTDKYIAEGKTKTNKLC